MRPRGRAGADTQQLPPLGTPPVPHSIRGSPGALRQLRPPIWGLQGVAWRISSVLAVLLLNPGGPMDLGDHTFQLGG